MESGGAGNEDFLLKGKCVQALQAWAKNGMMDATKCCARREAVWKRVGCW